jgi:hypothetical protein
MLKKFVLVTLSAFALTLAGCFGGGDDLEVKQLDVNGSSAELEDGRVTIDSAIDNGEFELVWKVDDDNASGYTASFYLSHNNDLDEDHDIEFYTVYCGEFGRCDHDDRNNEDCWFDNNLEMVCEDDDDPETDIDELIEALPEDLFIIIEACNSADCDTEAVPVRLR